MQLSVFDGSLNTATFRIVITGLAAGSWLEIATLKTSQSPAAPTGITGVSLSMRADVVLFVDDLSFRHTIARPVSRRTSSLDLRSVSTSSLALSARRN